MLTDALLDAFSAPANWLLGLLPDAVFDPAAAVGSGYADPSLTLGWIAAQSDLIQGGPGFIFNGGLIVGMLSAWLAIEAAIFAVRGIVWLKKAVLF
jgi:hypothetical protein